MSLISAAKAKAARGSVKEAFKNEAGAIDLASIMVGIIVIGLIGGVIAATVFAVIPWAQDNAAKQQLDSVVAAQSAAIGLGADTGAVSYPSPASGTNTITKDSRTLFNGGTTNDLGIKSNGTSGTGARYAAIVKSASGNYFRVTDQNTKPVQVNTPGVADLKTVAYSAIVGLTAAS